MSLSAYSREELKEELFKLHRFKVSVSDFYNSGIRFLRQGHIKDDSFPFYKTDEYIKGWNEAMDAVSNSIKRIFYDYSQYNTQETKEPMSNMTVELKSTTRGMVIAALEGLLEEMRARDDADCYTLNIMLTKHYEE
jgi:hypothetical protein